MRSPPRRSVPAPRQLSLLGALSKSGQLTADERREALALLATLLIEASSDATPEVTDDGE